MVKDGLVVGSPPCSRDLEDLVDLFANPLVGKTLGGIKTPDRTREILDRWLRRWSEGSAAPLIFRFQQTHRLLGYAGLAPADHVEPESHELLYALEPAFWGQGWATRASKLVLAELGSRPEVGEIIGFTLPSNRASQRVLEKVGFIYEQVIQHAGEPHVLYRLPRTERYLTKRRS